MAEQNLSKPCSPYAPPAGEVHEAGMVPANQLTEENRQLDEEVKASLVAKIENLSTRSLPESSSYLALAIENDIAAIIEQAGYRPAATVIGPPNRKNDAAQGADLAFNAVGMAREVKKNPVESAAELAAAIGTHECIAEVATAGPFVNIELDYEVVGPQIIAEVDRLGERFGYFQDGEPEIVIVDYSSPNVAKNMTVAHLRSTIIGHSLVKLQEAAGNIPFGVNHIGDWGTQFGNIIYQYRQEHADRGQAFLDELNDNPTAVLLRLYRDFEAQKDDDPEAVKEAQAIFLALEQGDPELVEIWG